MNFSEHDGMQRQMGHPCVRRPERSAASNLATFSGAREPVSDDDVAEAAHYAKYSYAACVLPLP